jgi:cytochrome c oxidase subunit 1
MATTTLTPTIPAYRTGLYAWLTTTDHKKIGIMYVINSFVFFFIGGLLALGVRSELAQPGLQFLTDTQYNEFFTMHATFMIFLFVIPMLAGFGNYIVPLQIGAPDMAFPRINALSLWMLPLAGILLLMGFVTGGTAAAGWTSYAPLSEDHPLAATGYGQDLWIVALVLIGTSSILGSINFLVTMFKMRAPGMTLFRMPIMVWSPRSWC